MTLPKEQLRSSVANLYRNIEVYNDAGEDITDHLINQTVDLLTQHGLSERKAERDEIFQAIEEGRLVQRRFVTKAQLLKEYPLNQKKEDS